MTAAIAALAGLDAVFELAEPQRDLLLARLEREHRSGATPAAVAMAAASGAPIAK